MYFEYFYHQDMQNYMTFRVNMEAKHKGFFTSLNSPRDKLPAELTEELGGGTGLILVRSAA